MAKNGDSRAVADSASGATLARAIRLYLEAKTAEGLSPRSIEWCSMVLERLARDFGPDREVDAISPAELWAWLVTLRETLSPGSVLGYYRAAKAFGNWLAREGLSAADPSWPARSVDETDRKVAEYIREYGHVTDQTLRRLFDIATRTESRGFLGVRRGTADSLGCSRLGDGVEREPQCAGRAAPPPGVLHGGPARRVMTQIGPEAT